MQSQTPANMQTQPLSSPQRVSLPVDNRVEKLLLWRHPLDSGLALFVITAAYFFLVWSNRSLVALLATSASIAVATSFVWSSLAAFLNKPGPPMPQLLREGLSESMLKRLVEDYTPLLNKGIALAHRVATGRDAILAGKVIAVLFVISKLGNVFSVLTWAYVVVLLAFSLPKIYELKKHEIDSGLSQAQGHAQKIHSQYVAPNLAKIPRGSTSTPFKAKPGQPSLESDVKKAM